MLNKSPNAIVLKLESVKRLFSYVIAYLVDLKLNYITCSLNI